VNVIDPILKCLDLNTLLRIKLDMKTNLSQNLKYSIYTIIVFSSLNAT